jgi:type II secretory pathway pseudopilin PulG
MSLTEVLMAAVVLAISASASLQVWASGGTWQRQASDLRRQQAELEAELLAVQGQLQQLAGVPLQPSCAAAAEQLVSQLPALRRQGEGVALLVQAADGSRRERWYDPAVYGLCEPEADDGQG